MGLAIPPQLEPLILPDRWARFVAEADAIAHVPKREDCWSRVFKIFYPPLAPVFLSWCRRQRASRLFQCTRRYSEGVEGTGGLWRALRARVTSTNNFALVFGCDRGATLAYLDTFDFTRSQLDWA